MVKLEPLADDASSGERGVIVNTPRRWQPPTTGQVGQEAYAASKGGVVALTLPLARDLAQFGVRVCTIAPGLFLTPLDTHRAAAGEVQESLAAEHPVPEAPGQARGVLHSPGRRHRREPRALNGEVIRLDGALRMAPR